MRSTAVVQTRTTQASVARGVDPRAAALAVDDPRITPNELARVVFNFLIPDAFLDGVCDGANVDFTVRGGLLIARGAGGTPLCNIMWRLVRLSFVFDMPPPAGQLLYTLWRETTAEGDLVEHVLLAEPPGDDTQRPVLAWMVRDFSV